MTKNSIKLNTKYERLVWILKGKNRRDIYRVLLKGNLTLIGICNLTGIARSNVHRIISDFLSHGLIEDITPDMNRGRFYKITKLGLEFKKEFKEHLVFHQNFRTLKSQR